MNSATPFSAQSTWTSGLQPNETAAADINGDGKIDLVVSNSQPKTISILLGNGDGSFQAPIATPMPQKGDHLTVADVNGDGKPDILSSERYTPS